MLLEILRQVQEFEKEAHKILGVHETSPSRIVLLDESYKKLQGLSVDQDELFKQALRCVENKLFRAAHVMAWAGMMDFLENKLFSTKYLPKLRKVRPNWNVKSIEQLREERPEYQIIEACHAVGLLSKNQKKTLHGLLSTRNECAHPSDFFPDLNISLGYISNVLQRIEIFQKKPT